MPHPTLRLADLVGCWASGPVAPNSGVRVGVVWEVIPRAETEICLAPGLGVPGDEGAFCRSQNTHPSGIQSSAM